MKTPGFQQTDCNTVVELHDENTLWLTANVLVRILPLQVQAYERESAAINSH